MVYNYCAKQHTYTKPFHIYRLLYYYINRYLNYFDFWVNSTHTHICYLFARISNIFVIAYLYNHGCVADILSQMFEDFCFSLVLIAEYISILGTILAFIAGLYIREGSGDAVFF